MKKQDELDLWDKVKDIDGSIWFPPIWKELGIDEKRGHSILFKWAKKGIVNYGTSVRGAWIEDKSKWKPN